MVEVGVACWIGRLLHYRPIRSYADRGALQVAPFHYAGEEKLVPKGGQKAIASCMLIDVLARSMVALQVADLSTLDAAFEAAMGSGAVAAMQGERTAGMVNYFARGVVAWFEADGTPPGALANMWPGSQGLQAHTLPPEVHSHCCMVLAV